MKLIAIISVFALVLGVGFASASDNCMPRKYNFHDKYNPMNGFYIEKNNNTNTAFYDINLTQNGQINPKTPLDSYWLLYAEDGRRDKITFVERRLAFGVKEIKEVVKGIHYTARIASMDRKIDIKYMNGCGWVEIDINGRHARLERVMLELSGSVSFSTLIYMDIYGRDLKTGEDIVERWYYDKSNKPKEQ